MADDLVKKFSAMDIMTTNKAAVSYGPKIEFRTDSDVVKGYTLRGSDDKPFTPSKIMFYNANQQMLMLTPKKRSSIFRIDTETGKNLGEISPHIHAEVSQPIDQVVPIYKYDNLKENPNNIETLVVSNSSIFHLSHDVRVPQKDTIINQDYHNTINLQGFKFTSIATTAAGDIVAGDNKGVVRLYNSPYKNGKEQRWKRSKTNLNQLPDSIKHVDVSCDGQWVIWTTSKYIAVANTLFTDKNGDIISGFKKSMGNNRPNALLLRIKDEDLKEIDYTEVDFEAAKFDYGPYLNDTDVVEAEIVTSTGNYIVCWNFRLIKLECVKGKVFESNVKPRIYKKDSRVVEKTFQYGKRALATAAENSYDVLDLNNGKYESEEEDEG